MVPTDSSQNAVFKVNPEGEVEGSEPDYVFWDDLPKEEQKYVAKIEDFRRIKEKRRKKAKLAKQARKKNR